MGDDEDFDLGDDLDLGDDSGDDFAGELDDMMGDDELGDDSDSGGDGDSELDSFFEDLSSIEEMDSGDDSDADMGGEAVLSAPVAAAVAAAPVEPAQEKSSPKGKKSKKKLVIIIIAILGVLLAAAVAYRYFFMQSDEAFPVEVEPAQEMMMVPKNTLILEEQQQRVIPRVRPALPVPLAPPPVLVAPPPPPKVTKYLIQIATCSFEKCVDDYLNEIRKAGEPTYQKESGDRYDFIELISSQVYHYREASDIVQTLNKENKQAGSASVVNQANGYRITMGTFTALNRAKSVKFHLEKLFPQNILVFNLEHVQRSYETTKIFAGPYDNRVEAKSILNSLKKKRLFRGAYLVRY
ncbi:MAG: hypothetical protein GY786_21870 [Proteobacteria bacterium]|nr:hypothetical protein [Pseudomonadota bacterium]